MTAPHTKRALVLTDGRARGSLAAVRALHGAGWTVGVGSPDGDGLEHVAAAGSALRTLQKVADATFWPTLTGGCRTARDPIAAIKAAGFRVDRSRRLRFPESWLPVPAAPHVLGVAVRPND